MRRLLYTIAHPLRVYRWHRACRAEWPKIGADQ